MYKSAPKVFNQACVASLRRNVENRRQTASYQSTLSPTSSTSPTSPTSPASPASPASAASLCRLSTLLLFFVRISTILGLLILLIICRWLILFFFEWKIRKVAYFLDAIPLGHDAGLGSVRSRLSSFLYDLTPEKAVEVQGDLIPLHRLPRWCLALLREPFMPTSVEFGQPIALVVVEGSPLIPDRTQSPTRQRHKYH